MRPLVGCVFSDVTATCRAWYGPPQQFAAALHPGLAPVWLVRIGWVALGLYAAYLLASTERLRRHREEQGKEQDAPQES
jgi:hypothetical protein